jgi:hypothetical protein
MVREIDRRRCLRITTGSSLSDRRALVQQHAQRHEQEHVEHEVHRVPARRIEQPETVLPPPSRTKRREVPATTQEPEQRNAS